MNYQDYRIILFDGVCNLCNSSVDFIIQRDKGQQFLLASLQSAAGQQILQDFNLPKEEFDTLVLVDRGRIYLRSTAALRIARELSGGWALFYAFIVVPAFLRDAVYRLVARHRFNWFGQRDSCRLPTPEERARFLEELPGSSKATA